MSTPSPAAREAAEWIAAKRAAIQTAASALGEVLMDTVCNVAVVPAEPVSVLPEGDGTGEGASGDLRAADEDALSRQLRAERDAARRDRDLLREEVTQLRTERDEARAERDRFRKLLDPGTEQSMEAVARIVHRVWCDDLGNPCSYGGDDERVARKILAALRAEAGKS